MIVEIENIGLFEYAKATIDDLTVIAGVNDTGKSTLGKVVFALFTVCSAMKLNSKH